MNSGHWLASLIVIAIGLSGCASLSGPRPAAVAKAHRTENRRQAAIQEFEARREQAELQAALNRWKEGNVPACEAALRALTQQRPQFQGAHLQLAELLLSQGDLEAAEQELRGVLAAAPDHPTAHHTLGMILEANNQPEESRKHLLRAVELDPQSDLFRLSLSPADPPPLNEDAVAPGAR